MAAPDSFTVEIESIVTAGVWTDVTTYYDGATGGSTKFGRADKYSAPQPATLTLTLDNADGRFTPLRQVLADGTTVHPYYPNLVPRKRIRIAWVIGGVSYYRFTGYIKGWPPSMVDGFTPKVVIQATDVNDRLSRTFLQWLPVEEVKAQTTALGGTAALYLMNDALPATGGSSPVFVDASGGGSPTLGVRLVAANNTVLSSAPLPIPAPDGLTGLAMVSNFSVSSTFPMSSVNFAFSFWLTQPVLPAGDTFAGTLSTFWNMGSSAIALQLGTNTAATPSGTCPLDISAYNAAGLLGTATATVRNDGAPHHIMALLTTSGTQTLAIYVDGVVGTPVSFAAQPASVIPVVQVDIIAPKPPSTAGPVVLGPISFHSGGAYTSALAVALAAAGRGFTGDKSGARIGRFLTYGGVPAGNQSLDVGAATLGPQPVNGQAVTALCQAVADTEGGGAAVYVTTTGLSRFADRNFRTPGPPSLTIDAGADYDGTVFTPDFSDTNIANRSTVSRSNSSGTVTTQTAADATSVAAFGPTNSDGTSYATTDIDALALAQDRIAGSKQPAYRLPQVAVDLMTATTAGLYAAVAGTELGERVRSTNLHAAAAPTPTIDGLVEGWADTFSANENTTVFDLSPADNPARGIWSGVRTNLVVNPSFETNVTGWTNGLAGSAVAQSATRSVVGTKSMLSTWGTSAASGQSVLAAFTTVAGSQYAISAWVWVPAGSPRVTIAGTQTGFLPSVVSTPSSVTDAWQFLYCTFTAPTTGSQVIVRPFDAATAGQLAYVDAVLIEQRSGGPLAYFDGSLAADVMWTYAWTGVAHASTSTATSKDAYSRWQAAPDCALNAAITSSATTVVIKSPTAPTFTTVAARYPLTILVEQEQITLNSVPTGAVSPQQFNGVTRGVNGTTAAAQAINARVQLSPAATWTL